METREILRQLKAEIEKTKLETSVQELGRVLSVRDGVVRISGLSSIGASELLTIRTSAGQEVSGLALSLDTSDVGVIAFRGWEEVREGDEAVGTGRVLSLPVGDAFLGRVVNPLGEPLDGKGVVRSNLRMPLERLAPGVIERKSVDTSLMTGIKAIDAMIPIGRGQRELVIGDRQTGKTAIVSDTIVNQKGTGVVCIYVAVGQKLSKVRRIVAHL